MRKCSPYGTWRCNKCNLVFKTRKEKVLHSKTVHPIQPGSSWNAGLTKETDPRISKLVEKIKELGKYNPPLKGKHLPDSTKKKLSESMKRYFRDNPSKVPYILNHSSKESFPERYFKEIFMKEGFPQFIRNKHVLTYFLDFAFEDKMAFIEIDGEQHYTDKRIIEHDRKRYDELSKTKWKCIARIRWSKYQKLTEDQRKKFISGVKQKLESIS